MAFLVFVLLFNACSNDESNEAPDNQDSQFNDVALSAEMDLTFATIEGYIVEVFDQEMASPLLRKSQSKNVDCATISGVFSESTGTITIVYNADGCIINSHKYEGEMVINYEYNLDRSQVSIEYQLTDFYFDGKQISGTSTIVNFYADGISNPQRTHVVDLTVTWPNNVMVSRRGTIVAEWVEGYTTVSLEDNVFEVSGLWDDTFANTYTNSYVISEALIRKGGCDYFVSGLLSIDHVKGSAVINFGDGNCDSTAVLTFNGMEYTIEVEK